MENSDLDLIEAFLGNKMSPEERADFKQRLGTDPALQTALRQEEVMREALRRRHDEQLLARFKENKHHLFQKQQPQKKRGYFLQNFGRLAASLVLLIAAAYFIALPLLRQNEKSALYKENYTRLAYSGDLSASTEEKESQLLADAFKAYQAKNYPQAINNAAPLLQSSRYADWAKMLTGAAKLEQDDTQGAIVAFQGVNRTALSLYNRAQWNIAMAHLKAGNTNEARTQLESIATDSENVLAARAKELLNKLTQ